MRRLIPQFLDVEALLSANERRRAHNMVDAEKKILSVFPVRRCKSGWQIERLLFGATITSNIYFIHWYSGAFRSFATGPSLVPQAADALHRN